MAVVAYGFKFTKQWILSGDVRLLHDDLKVMLVTNGFVYSNLMATYADIVGLEITEQLYYPAGGIAVTGRSVYTDDTTLKSAFYIDPLEYPALEADVVGAVMYADLTTPGLVEKPLLTYCDFGTVLNFDTAIFRFNWPGPVIRW